MGGLWGGLISEQTVSEFLAEAELMRAQCD